MSADLIERLEKATGPDRALDIAIGVALDIETSWSGDLAQLGYGQGPFIALGARPYTASIDAALTLVPEFCKVMTRPSGGAAGCNGHTTPTTWAEAATPALALCIAALKARASRNPPERA